MERIVDVEKVLMNEIDNLHGVYLYLEGDSWCAYERSAYYLAKLKCAGDTTERSNPRGVRCGFVESTVCSG